MDFVKRLAVFGLAVAVGVLLADGRLSPYSPVAPLLGLDIPPDVVVRDLLTHQVGGLRHERGAVGLKLFEAAFEVGGIIMGEGEHAGASRRGQLDSLLHRMVGVTVHHDCIVPRDERTYSEFAKTVFTYLPFVRTLHRWQLYWTNEVRVWPIFKPSLGTRVEHLLTTKFIQRVVKNPEVAKKLTPDYRLGCKRILISNKWYAMFNRPNVELVTDGIKEVTPTGVITKDGQERAADCIILGTGFVVDPRIYMKSFEMRGLGGHTVQEDWKVSPTSYYGITTANYPNMYQLVGPHTGLGHNSIIFMIEAQAEYIVQCMKKVKEKGVDYIDVKPQAMVRFLGEMSDALKGTVWSSGCKSWYQTADGINFAIWPKSTWRYWMETRTVNEGDYNFVKCGGAKTSGKTTGAGSSGIVGLAGDQAMAGVAQR